MSTSEWMELETLSTQIAHAQSRLDAARATKNMGLVQLLEREITHAETRRAQVIADITNGLGLGHSARSQLVAVPVPQPEQSPVRQEHVEEAQAQSATAIASDEPSPGADTEEGKEGVVTMWDNLTRADLERVKRELTNRRSEMLARHADELKALETEQREIDAIEQAIIAFTQKFKLRSTAEVVSLAGERMTA